MDLHSSGGLHLKILRLQGQERYTTLLSPITTLAGLHVRLPFYNIHSTKENDNPNTRTKPEP